MVGQVLRHPDDYDHLCYHNTLRGRKHLKAVLTLLVPGVVWDEPMPRDAAFRLGKVFKALRWTFWFTHRYDDNLYAVQIWFETELEKVRVVVQDEDGQPGGPGPGTWVEAERCL